MQNKSSSENDKKDIEQSTTQQGQPSPTIITSPVNTIQPTPVRRVENCFITAPNQLPSNWPDDFPFYKNSFVHSVKCAPNSSDIFEVRLRTDDDFDTVLNSLVSDLKSKNWRDILNEKNDLNGIYFNYNMVTAKKLHKNNTREIILDVRKGPKDYTDNKVEIIYRERAY